VLSPGLRGSDVRFREVASLHLRPFGGDRNGDGAALMDLLRSIADATENIGGIAFGIGSHLSFKSACISQTISGLGVFASGGLGRPVFRPSGFSGTAHDIPVHLFPADGHSADHDRVPADAVSAKSHAADSSRQSRLILDNSGPRLFDADNFAGGWSFLFVAFRFGMGIEELPWNGMQFVLLAHQLVAFVIYPTRNGAPIRLICREYAVLLSV